MQKLRILIAEDDLASRRLLEASLTNWGHEVIPASDGLEAKTLLAEGGIHVCVLDWEMPKMDGVEVCRWLRSANLSPDPYVIVLTARHEPEHVKTVYDVGANDYMAKPFDRGELRNRIADFATQVLPLMAARK